MPIMRDLRKVPAETQAMVLLRDISLSKRACALEKLARITPPNQMMPLCYAAYEFGFKDFARKNVPKTISPDLIQTLTEAAKSVCKTNSSFDMVFLLSTLPVRNDGELYARPGKVVKICFKDGTSVYCKSRSIYQEALGFDLLGLLGYPTLPYLIKNGWFILAAANGRSLEDCSLFPELRPNIENFDQSAFYNDILGFVAFDYIFGMLDRNEKSVFMGFGSKPMIIDHEYLLLHTAMPMIGKQFLLYRMYLDELGFPSDLVRRDNSIYENCQSAHELFEKAIANEFRIMKILETHIKLRQGEIDLGFTAINLDFKVIEETSKRIHAGLERFLDRLIYEMEVVRDNLGFGRM
ncbi:hypothetical protein KJ780_01125 [Candidatus Micrarchaeota archaeon]|nr:hypothetical protein [Candidatus Micrarchaeota archaeon]